MRSILTRQDYEQIYRLLDTVSPVPFDCGSVCGAACCGGPAPEFSDDGSPADPGACPALGIYLLPGEEQLFTEDDEWFLRTEDRAQDYDFPASWQGTVTFLRCRRPPHCPRERRPVQCRTFPLLPHLDEDGTLSLVWNDQVLPYACPLVEQRAELSPEFLRVTREAWRRLLIDPLIRDLVESDSAARRKNASP